MTPNKGHFGYCQVFLNYNTILHAILHTDFGDHASDFSKMSMKSVEPIWRNSVFYKSQFFVVLPMSHELHF